ncbi:MAG: efflux RND transporter periplasmic adaptor subunit [Acidobacteriota bacterium]
MKNHALGSCLLLGSWLLLPPQSAEPQGPPPSPVRYTEAVDLPVRRQIQLPGSVEPRTSSLVASEVEGLVIQLAAREGQTVGKGQVLVELRKDHLELQLKAASAQLREAEARLKQAETNRERSQDLFDSEVLSRRQLDDSRYEFDAWQGRVDQLKAEIARTRLDIERSIVRAPFAGVVVAEGTEVGEWIGKGDPILEMISLYELEIRVEVPERYFRNINLGAEATVRFPSLPGYEVKGRVSSVIPRANPQARTFPLKIRVRNKDGRIGAGMLAEVTFPAGEAYRATVVPKDAVITRGERRFVYLLNGDSTVNMVPVKTGVGVGAWVEVQGPVRPGAKVVTRGNERIRPGQKVQGHRLEYALP